MFEPLLEIKIAKLTNFIKEKPTAIKYRIRSFLYLRQGHYHKALADAEKALELEQDAWNYERRGEIYFAMKNFGAALADYCKAIELDPDVGIRNTLDYFRPILKAKRDKMKIKRLMNRIAELEPNDAFNFKKRGDYYFAMKKYDAALADYCKAVEFEPEITFMNHHDSFEPTLTQHRIIGCTKSRNYEKRGHLYFELGNYKKAIADYNKVISKHYYVKDDKLYLRTAQAHYRLGNRLEAVRYFRKAFNGYTGFNINDTHVAEAYFEYGVACYELKLYKDAIDNFDRYIFFKPEDSEGYKMRAKCYRALHDESKAQVDLARVRICGRRLF